MKSIENRTLCKNKKVCRTLINYIKSNEPAKLWKNRKVWRDFVHLLIYPGVLGSMIFDLLDPLRQVSITQLTLLFIACLFAIDYLHLFNNIKSSTKFPTSNDPRPIIDAAIAISYCLGYFALSATTSDTFQVYRLDQLWLYQLTSMYFVTLALILAAYYNSSSTIKRDIYWFIDASGKILSAVFCIISMIFICLYHPVNKDDAIFIEIVITICTLFATSWYLCYVAIWASKREVPYLQKKDERRDKRLGKECLILFFLVVIINSYLNKGESVEGRLKGINNTLNNPNFGVKSELSQLKHKFDETSSDVYVIMNIIAGYQYNNSKIIELETKIQKLNEQIQLFNKQEAEAIRSSSHKQGQGSND